MKEENSALVEEILAEFFKELTNDAAVPTHVVTEPVQRFLSWVSN